MSKKGAVRRSRIEIVSTWRDSDFALETEEGWQSVFDLML